MVFLCIFLQRQENINVTIEEKSSNKEKILDDVVIQYLAHRHHATADDVVDSAIKDDSTKVNLEDNEKNIIRNLISMYNNDCSPVKVF